MAAAMDNMAIMAVVMGNMDIMAVVWVIIMDIMVVWATHTIQEEGMATICLIIQAIIMDRIGMAVVTDTHTMAGKGNSGGKDGFLDNSVMEEVRQSLPVIPIFMRNLIQTHISNTKLRAKTHRKFSFCVFF